MPRRSGYTNYEMMVLRGKGGAIIASGGLTYLAWTDGKFRADDVFNPIAFGLTAASFKFPHVEHAITGWALTKALHGAGRVGKFAAKGVARVLPGVGTALIAYDAYKFLDENVPGSNDEDWAKDERGFETIYTGDNPHYHMMTTIFPDWFMSSDRVN